MGPSCRPPSHGPWQDHHQEQEERGSDSQHLRPVQELCFERRLRTFNLKHQMPPSKHAAQPAVGRLQAGSGHGLRALGLQTPPAGPHSPRTQGAPPAG